MTPRFDELADEPDRLLLGLGLLEPAVLEPDGVAVVVEGMGCGVAGRSEGEERERQSGR